MNHQRQEGNNYGSVLKLYLAKAADYPSIKLAQGATETMPQAVIDQYFHLVEFEFEGCSYQQDQQPSTNGPFFRHTIKLTLARWNAQTRAFHSFWYQKKIIALVCDFMSNELLIGSDAEYLVLKGSKPGKLKITQGSNLVLNITGDTALPV